MENKTLDGPSGYDDALYRTIGLVVRHLHVRGLIEAPELIREMHFLADQQQTDKEASQECIDGLRGMAHSFEREQDLWSEARVIHDLYRDRSDH